jgi:hypothetical protein
MLTFVVYKAVENQGTSHRYLKAFLFSLLPLPVNHVSNNTRHSNCTCTASYTTTNGSGISATR